MTLVLTVPNGQRDSLVDLMTETQTPVRALVAEYDLPSCVAVAGFTTSAINAALATGSPEVCFPPGVYDVTAPINQTANNQVLNFQPGAVLRFAASGLGTLNINGAAAQIIGDPVARWEADSSATYVAIDLHGSASMSVAWRFELNAAEVINCTLIRLSGDYAQLDGALFAGLGGSFKYGVLLSKQDGTSVGYCRVGTLTWQMGDNLVSHTYSALLRYRSIRSQCGPVSITNGLRHFFNAIIEVDGQHNSLKDPQINSSAGSNYGILCRDQAEFFGIYDGEIVGNYLASSVGIQCGDNSTEVNPATGQLKCYNTKIRNWDIGVRITGSSDTPEFFGATIANNKTAQVQIDSHRTAGDWPVSGLGFFGCYSECQAFACPFLHLKSGALAAGVVSGCFFGIVDTCVLVEAGMGGNSMEFLGSRLAMSAPTDAVTTPNTNSRFFFGLNAFVGSSNISKGAFASKATSIDNQVCSTVQTTGSLTIGTSGTPITARLASFFTANFGAGIPANDQVTLLPFNFPGILVTDYLNWTLNGAPPAATELTFTCWISAAGQVTLRARNNTASPVGPVSGTLLCQVFRGF